MARFDRNHGPTGIHDPNVTPIIDVALVLVIILLVATPMALQSGIALSRAAASARAGAPQPVARVEISIVDAQHVSVNRILVDRAAFGPTLQALLRRAPVRDVLVRCADGVPHGVFVSVIDEAKANGAGAIAVLGS
jgi:biopolymer transport protein ExbD